MRPDTIQEELFKLFTNLGGNVTALNSNSYTSQAWLHQINELVAGGGVGAIKVSPTAPVSPVAGDLWYNRSTGILGFWNGTYWLSSHQLIASHPQFNLYVPSSTQGTVAFTAESLPPIALFVEQITLSQLNLWFFEGVTSFILNVGLSRPQSSIASGGHTLLSRDVFANPLVVGNNTFSVNTFVASSSARRVQIEYLQSGATGVTNSSYIQVNLTYRLVLA